jgi:hypothetical protein
MNFRSSLLNLNTLGVALVATLLIATAASADVTLTAVGTILTGPNAGSNDTTLAANGEQVQVDIFMSNNDSIAGATFAAGISGGDFGAGASTLNFDSGLTSASWFNTNFNKFGGPAGGVTNTDGTDNGIDGTYTSISLPKGLSGSNITLSGNIRFFAAFVTMLGDGNFDFGSLTGATAPGGTPDVTDTGAGGAAHARLLFTVVGGGAVLDIGTNAPDDSLTPSVGASGVLNGDSIQVPEPASLTLGLSALASVFAVVGFRRRMD